MTSAFCGSLPCSWGPRGPLPVVSVALAAVLDSGDGLWAAVVLLVGELGRCLQVCVRLSVCSIRFCISPSRSSSSCLTVFSSLFRVSLSCCSLNISPFSSSILASKSRVRWLSLFSRCCRHSLDIAWESVSNSCRERLFLIWLTDCWQTGSCSVGLSSISSSLSLELWASSLLQHHCLLLVFVSQPLPQLLGWWSLPGQSWDMLQSPGTLWFHYGRYLQLEMPC